MICAAGCGDDWQKLVRPGTQVIDARGGTVLPGFIDNHFHVMQTAVNMMSVDLGGARSHRELGEMLAAAEKREGAVLGCQVEESQFEEKRFPDRYVLDRYCSDSPVVLFSKEYHVSMLNTHALLYYKVPLLPGGRGAGRQRPAYGHFPAERQLCAALQCAAEPAGRVPHGGHPSGHVPAAGKRHHHRGGHRGRLAVRRPGRGVHLRPQRRVSGGYAAVLSDHGPGEGLEAGAAPGGRQYYGGRHPVQPQRRPVGTLRGPAGLPRTDLPAPGRTGRVRAAVLPAGYAAGAVQHRRPGHRVRAAGPRGAIRQGGSTALRHRIEHAIMATPEQIARAADMKLIFSVQPAYAYLWGGKGGMYERRVGERYLRSNNFAAMFAAARWCAAGRTVT